jgi:hypothetical protein
MTRRFSELLFLLLLGVAIAVAPIACGSDDANGDGSVDRVTSMTPG